MKQNFFIFLTFFDIIKLDKETFDKDYFNSEENKYFEEFSGKKDYIKRMKASNDVNVINIMLADKLHNLISNYESFLKYGDKLWKNTGGTKDENRYIYREIYNIARNKNANDKLLNRYREIVTIYFGELENEEE